MHYAGGADYLDAERLPEIYEIPTDSFELPPDTPDAYSEAAVTVAEDVVGAEYERILQAKRAQEEIAAIHHSDDTAERIAGAIASANAKIAKTESPNPYYPYRIARGVAKGFGILTRTSIFEKAVDSTHQITSVFRTRRSERNYFGIPKEDLTQPVKAMRRNARIKDAKDSKIDAIAEELPGVSRETIKRAIGTGREHLKNTVRVARRRLHGSAFFANKIGTKREAAAIAEVIRGSNELQEDDEAIAA